MSPTRRWSRRAVLSTAATGIAAVAGCSAPNSSAPTGSEEPTADPTSETTSRRTTTTDDTETRTPTETTAARVDRETDIAFRETPQRTLKLDLYRPADDEDRPFVVFAHGGAWISGDKGHRPMFDRLVAAGYVVADVQYRLAQQRPYPAPARDVVAAVKWLRANADRYGVHADHGVLAGYSAGAHLAGLAALAPDVEAFQPEGLHPDVPAAVDAFVGYSGPYDLTTEGLGGNPIVAGFLGASGDDQRRREASPITHVGENSPPAILIHGTEDRIVPYRSTEKLAAAYQDASVPVKVFRADGGGHGVINSPGWRDRTVPKVVSFLENHVPDG